jgi:uncharacterized protein DUF3352
VVARSGISGALVALAVTAVLAAGCGNAASSASGQGDAAAAMPSGTLVYADVNLDQGSDAWKQFAAVGQRFPGWTTFSAQLTKSLDSKSSSSQLTFSKDVEPWLGNDAGIGVTSVDAAKGSAHFLAFIASSDDGKAKAAVSQDSTSDGSYHGYDLFTAKDATSPAEIAVGDGAVLVADDQQALRDAIDTRDGQGDDLASDGAFSSAMSKLPKDSLVRGYVNTRKVAELVSVASMGAVAGPNAGQLQNMAKSLNSIDSLSFAAWAGESGYHLSVRTTLEPGADPSLVSSGGVTTLTKLVPSDAFAFLGFAGNGDILSNALTGGGPAAAQQLQQFTRTTGLSVKRDLVPLLSGEGVFYAAPGLPVSASLVLKPKDPQAAAAAMHKVTALIASSQPGAKVTTSGNGQTVKARAGLALSWQLTPDGLITIGNDPNAGSAPASPLESSSAYLQLLSDAGVPAGASVPLYVNVTDALKLFPVQVDPNLKHVGALLAWSSHDGQDYSSDVFVQVT